MPRSPLSTPLSQLLIAFTIELDNEFERRFAAAGVGRRFGLSLVMWSNFMRFVGDGIAVGELPEVAGQPKPRVLSMVGGMERWRYVFVGPESAPEPESKRDGWGSGRGLRREWVVRPTPAGRKTQELWPPLHGDIERRWAERFGTKQLRELRQSLETVVGQLDIELPEYLPLIAGTNGLAAEVVPHERQRAAGGHLSTLLAQALLAYTLDFERESEVSLPLSANFLRVLGETGLDVRELPAAAGVSKEATSIALRFLTKGGLCRRGRADQAGAAHTEGRRSAAGGRPRARGRGASLAVAVRRGRRRPASRRRCRPCWTSRRGSLRACNRPRTAGARASPTQSRRRPCSTTRSDACPTIRWCCTAAAGPTAADDQRSVTASRTPNAVSTVPVTAFRTRRTTERFRSAPTRATSSA